jgi:uncharacterized protein (DUF302 family)
MFGVALAAAVFSFTAQAADAGFSLSDTVVRVPLEEDVTMDDAVDSMKLRANVLNLKFVAHQPLYKELQAMGIDSRRIEIFQFCDARIAWEMIKHDMNFAAYMPCRIALLEDEKGQGWLVMADLDFFTAVADLPPDFKAMAVKVRDNLQEIIEAGSAGDL